MPRSYITIGTFLMALAVILGAFAAHALRDKLDPYSAMIWEKAGFYHFVHAMALVMLGITLRSGLLMPREAWLVALLFILGVSLFCGSLYILALTKHSWLGMITPLGGISFIAGWIMWAYYSMRSVQ